MREKACRARRAAVRLVLIGVFAPMVAYLYRRRATG
jgi:hypothetical protein